MDAEKRYYKILEDHDAVISAAPALLKACMELLDFIDAPEKRCDYGCLEGYASDHQAAMAEHKKICNQARAAIAKAEGGE